MIQHLIRWVAWMDSATGRFTQGLAWLPLLMATLMVVVVLVRHAFGQGSIALQEAVLYAHAAVLMLGISYGLQTNSHVRVDVLYNRCNDNQRRWINLLGHLLFLLPLCITIFVQSLPYVAASWRVLEGSPEVGGIPGIFVLKTLIPVTAVLVALQTLTEIIRLMLRLPPASESGPS